MISVITYGRNDSHGYNLPKRGAISFNCIAEVLTHPDDEIIFVDCNTPDDLPTFPESIADTLTPRAKKLLRILRLRPASYEKGKNGAKFKVLEPLCRNVGIRRSNPANRWILNTNTDMVFTPIASGKSLADLATGLADGFYELPRFEVPEILWETMDRQNPSAIIAAFQRWGRRLHLNEKVANVPEILFDGPGDFQLALREQMFAIHGMDERMTLGWHVDSNLCKRLFLLNGETKSLLDRCYAYHCDHTRLNTIYHSAAESTSNDWRIFFRGVTTPYLPQQAETWGLPDEPVEEIRLTEERGSRYEHVLNKLLPGLREPMLESALKSESFNHGLLYDTHHVLPYVADHLTMISPAADFGYVGGNARLLGLIAQFRQEFGHTGRVFFAQELMDENVVKDSAIPSSCVAVPGPQILRESFVVCFDFWMGRFPTRNNQWGYAVTEPSETAGRFAASVFRFLYEFAKIEKRRLRESKGLARKSLFLGTQNTWAEPAVTQLFGVVMTPYSSYTRHGYLRQDALENPMERVPGHHLFATGSTKSRTEYIAKRTGQRVAEMDMLLMELRLEALTEDSGDDEFDSWVRSHRWGNPQQEQALLETLILEAELQGQFEKADKLRELQHGPEQLSEPSADRTPRTIGKSSGSVPESKHAIRGKRVLGVDARSLFDSPHLATGARQYAARHLRSLVDAGSDWNFVLIDEEPRASLAPEVESLLRSPNVERKLLGEVTPGSLHGLHVLDPFYDLSGPSPMELVQGVPTTALAHSLTELRCYFYGWERSRKRDYLVRLDQIRSRAARVFTSSDFARKDFLSATGIEPRNVVVVSGGADNAEELQTNALAPDADVLSKHGIAAPYFLHVGSLEPHKNFKTVLRALSGLSNQTTRLVVVGEKGGTLKQVADFAARNGLKNVTFTGYVPRHELNALYRQAAALVVASAYEGFPWPVLEAMGLGCPVIASNLRVIAECAGDAALTFPSADDKVLSQALRRLLDDGNLRQAMSRAGRARAAQFAWRNAAGSTLAAWEELLGRERANAPLSTSDSNVETPAPVSSNVASASDEHNGHGLVWIAPWQNSSGYAGEALAFVQGIHEELDVELVEAAKTKSPGYVASLPETQRGILEARLRERVAVAGKIVVQHLPAYAVSRFKGAAYHIARTMFETDRIPADWVTRCNRMDEVWVPSRFNLETFAASGVDRDKLVLMPGTIDEHEFDPGRHQPLELPHRAGFNFLFVAQWSVRKGWDTLLSAYLREFSSTDDVGLYLRCVLPGQTDRDPERVIRESIRKHTESLGLNPESLPRIEILAQEIPPRQLPRLYKAVDCLVAPSRGEGWGRPQHEAMLMELPVIATHWSATTEFMNATNSYLIDYELAETRNLERELQHLEGHRWAGPSETHLRQLMRQVFSNREEARAKGRVARTQLVQNFGIEVTARRIQDRLNRVEAKIRSKPAYASSSLASTDEDSDAPQEISESKGGLSSTKTPSPNDGVSITWEGSFLDYGSLSHVNREVTKALEKLPSVQLSRVNSTRSSTQERSGEFAEIMASSSGRANAPAKVVVRHGWPPNWQRPKHGAWVLTQPWEYGALPSEWVRNIAQVDEVWVPSEYVRHVYISSGIPESKVKVVPNGIDPDKFHPGIAPMKLATGKKFKFLFVGATIHRKGPDVLLKAYLRAFSAKDDVCLVIKDFGGDSIYGGQTLKAQIKTMQALSDAPEILYLEEELTPDQLPALYGACDCLVHPYRGEGFGLPVLEAMACGLPVIVTRGGATDDFATDEVAYRIPASRRTIGRQVSGMPLANDGWVLEPSLPALIQRMNWVFHHREEARAQGQTASEHARRDWTWARAAHVVAANACRLSEEHGKRSVTRTFAKSATGLPVVAAIGNLTEARTLFQRGQFVEAWNAAIATVQQRPFHPEAALLLAEIALAANDTIRARQCLDWARRMTPRWPAIQKLANAFPKKAERPRVALPQWPQGFLQNGEPRISVCLITKNEAEFLARCLSSVREIASQIIVVDTGSTDRTIDIAREFAAEVCTFSWCDDFSAARNAALERATGDWVLVIDADEELTLEGRAQLQRDIRDSSAMAYRLPIFDAGEEANGCDYVPRLFRNAPGTFFKGTIHEQAFSSFDARQREWAMEIKLGHAALRHHGYSERITKDRSKIARNLRLLERALTESPQDINLLMNLALERMRNGEKIQGLENYREAFRQLAAAPPKSVSPELRETLLTQFVAYLLQARQFDELIDVLESAPAVRSGLTASLHFAFGLALSQRGQYRRAADQMRQCIAKRDRHILTKINPEIRKAGPHHCLAICLARLGQQEAAEKAFKKALKIDPKSRRVRFDYVRWLGDTERKREALHILYQLVSEDSSDSSAWELGEKIALSDPALAEFAADWVAEARDHFRRNAMVASQRSRFANSRAAMAEAIPA